MLGFQSYLAGPNFVAAVWDGVSWTEIVLVLTENYPTLAPTNFGVASALDPSDTIHVFAMANGQGPYNTIGYLQMLADNSLSLAQIFHDSDFSITNQTSGTELSCVVVNDSIILGVCTASNQPALWTAAPLASPVFSLSPPIDAPPVNLAAFSFPGYPYLDFDGATLWGVWYYLYGAMYLPLYRGLSSSTPPFTSGWTASTILDGGIAGLTYPSGAGGYGINASVAPPGFGASVAVTLGRSGHWPGSGVRGAFAWGRPPRNHLRFASRWDRNGSVLPYLPSFRGDARLHVRNYGRRAPLRHFLESGYRRGLRDSYSLRNLPVHNSGYGLDSGYKFGQLLDNHSADFD